MNHKHVIGLIVTTRVLCLGTPAHANISLSVVPSAPTVDVGDFVDIDIVISGLIDALAPSVGVYDINVLFDDDIIAFDDVVFGPRIGGDLDVFDLGGNPTFATPFVDGVNLFELSLDTPMDLNDHQVDEFIVATLTFQALTTGFSSLELFINELGDADGAPLTASTSGGGITVIPAPASAVLAALGMSLAGWIRRRY